MPNGLDQSDIERLVRSGYLSPEQAASFAPPQNQLETLSRDSDPIAPPPAPPPIDTNSLGSPGVLETVTGLPIDKYLGAAKDPVNGAAAAIATPPPQAPSSSSAPFYDNGDQGSPVKPNSTSLIKPISLPPDLQNQGAAFGAPAQASDLQPSKNNGQVDVKLSPKTAELAGQVAQRQADDGLLKHGETFNKMADNPSLRGGESNGPATPEDPSPAGQAIAALAHNAIGNGKAIDNWKAEVAKTWDGYVGAPLDKQIALAGQQGELQKKLADELYQGSVMSEAIATQAKQRDADAKMKDQDVIQKKLDDLEKYNQEIRDTKIDPSRLWSSMSTERKVGIGIAAFLGALAGGANSHVLSNMVDRDVAIQMQNLNNKKDYSKEQRGVISDQVKALGDKNAIREAARGALLESLSAQVANISKSYGGQDAQMKAQILQSEIEKQKADSYQKLWSFLNPDPRRPAGVGAGIPKSLHYDGSKTVTLGDGLSFIASDEKAASEIRDTVESADEVSSAVARMKELIKDPKTYVPGTAQYNEYESQVQRMRLNTDSKFLGVAKSEEGRKILNDATAVPSQYSLETEKKLDKLQQRVELTKAAKVRAQNGTIVHEQFVKDPTTNMPTRVSIPTGDTTSSYGLTPKRGGNAGSPIQSGAAPTEDKKKK